MGDRKYRPTRIVLSEKALLHNVKWIRRRGRQSRIIAMVKANAYGHGLCDVARRIESCVDMLGVASVDEAIDLRRSGIEKPILLVQGIFSPQEWPVVLQQKLDIVIHTPEQLEWMPVWADMSRSVRPWIKVNTGMGRLGFAPDVEHIYCLLRRLKAHPNLCGDVGILSHFSCANTFDHAHNAHQIARFRSLCRSLSHHSGPRSLCNSGGMIHFDACHDDYVRPGIVMYGIHPCPSSTGQNLGLRPVMHFMSQLIAVNFLNKGHPVGYGNHYLCPEDMNVGIVAVGYGDGYPYHCHGACVIVGGKQCPVIGQVSMDMMAVDLRSHPGACVGDSVTLWGPNFPVEIVARSIGHSAYALTTGLQKRVDVQWI